jgi:hypothetical protein
MESSNVSGEGSVIDYGAMIIAPISKLLFNNTSYNFSNTTTLKPLLNFTLGYSTTNVGGKISYLDPAQTDPIVRTARLGYTFDFGFDAFINSAKLNIITYSFTAEAEDNLLLFEEKNYSLDKATLFGIKTFTGYQSFLGNIDITQNLINLKPDENVVVHKGHTFNLFETLTITVGRYSGKYYAETIKTNGYGLSSEGISKMLELLSRNKTVNYFASHFILEFYDVTIFAESEVVSNMQGISLDLKNIAF